MTENTQMIDLREELADLCHRQWSGWMMYLFKFTHFNEHGDYVIDADKALRWIRQMKTSYKDLPEDEKESDRKEADRFLEIVMPLIINGWIGK